jgi:periplasmic protein TonB
MSTTKRPLGNKVLLAIAFLFLFDGATLLAQDPADKLPEGVYRPGHGVTAPKPFYTPQPEYSEKARKQKINGSVMLMMVVTEEGKVRDVKVIKGLDRGLDKQAIAAVSTWKFEPGTKDGKPVAVQLSVEVDFHLY